MSVYTPYCIYFLFISELRFSISFVGISNEACGDVNVFQYWHTWNWLLMFRLMYSSHRKKWRKFLINWHCLLLTNYGNKIKVNSFIDLAGHCTGFWSLDLSTLWWASFPSTYRYMKGMYVLNYLPGNQLVHNFSWFWPWSYWWTFISYSKFCHVFSNADPTVCDTCTCIWKRT